MRYINNQVIIYLLWFYFFFSHETMEVQIGVLIVYFSHLYVLIHQTVFIDRRFGLEFQIHSLP